MSSQSENSDYSEEYLKIYKGFKEHQRNEYSYPEKCLTKIAHTFLESDKRMPEKFLPLLRLSFELVVVHNFFDKLNKERMKKELADSIIKTLIERGHSLSQHDLQVNINELFNDQHLSYSMRGISKSDILEKVVGDIDNFKKSIYPFNSFSKRDDLGEECYEVLSEYLKERKKWIEDLQQVFKNPNESAFAKVWDRQRRQRD